MADPNGSGQDDDDWDEDEHTPNELPEATLALHRRYLQALVAVIAPLRAVCQTLQEIAHELRIARDPVGRSLLSKVAQAGEQIEGIGHKIAEQFER